MKTTFARCALIALFLQVVAPPNGNAKTPATAPASQPAAGGGKLAALERKLLGTWNGAPCEGDYTFNADGTYELRHFTPGDNTLTGVWSLRWDALPPTLILTCKTSDFKKRVRDFPEYEYLGKAVEVKLLELNDETLMYRSANAEWEWRGYRPGKEWPRR